MSEGADGSGPSVVLDAEARRLRLEAEKAKYRQAIASSSKATTEAAAASMAVLSPEVADAPKGEVSLGEGAGAFGPWRAHATLAGLGRRVADGARNALYKAKAQSPRVLVVGDQSIFGEVWTAGQVEQTLDRIQGRLSGLEQAVRRAQRKLSSDQVSIPRRSGAQPVSMIVVDSSALGPGGGVEVTERADLLRMLRSPTAKVSPVDAGASTGGAAGAFGAAVDLMALLRTDYTLTATPVAATTDELLTLTAAALGRQVRVEVDDFGTPAKSKLLTRFARILSDRDKAARAVSDLQVQLAPLESRLVRLGDRVTALESAWAKVATDAKDKDARDALRAALDGLIFDAATLDRAVGPAKAALAAAQAVVSDVDAAVTTLLKSPEAGEPPLLTAARRDRLDAAVKQDRVTHVLYVSTDALAADAITRRSILGMSGRIHYTAAASASWLLVDTATSRVVGGGQVRQADILTFDLEAVAASYDDNGFGLVPASLEGKDPLIALEGMAKVLVIVLVLVLLVTGVAGTLALLAAATG